MMKLVNLVLLIVILIVGISFAILNANPVMINYLLGKKILPLSLLLIITLTVGAILGWLAGMMLFLKQKSKGRRLKQRIQLMEQELDNLRSMPLRDTH